MLPMKQLSFDEILCAQRLLESRDMLPCVMVHPFEWQVCQAILGWTSGITIPACWPSTMAEEARAIMKLLRNISSAVGRMADVC